MEDREFDPDDAFRAKEDYQDKETFLQQLASEHRL